MSHIERIQELIDTVNDLPKLDFDKLDALKKRSDMIIRNMFGDSSQYLNDLRSINFPSRISGSEKHYKYYEQSWLSAKAKMLNIFNAMSEEIKLFGGSENVNNVQNTNVDLSNRIFVVHGHDEEMKQAVARTLNKIGLDPIILHEQPNKGRTIIEKFTDYSDVSFAVVLLSPDDMAYSKERSPKDAKPRARQNVIFELGFFIGKLCRDRVLALYKEEKDFEIPSDYSGVLYTPYDSAGQWRFELVRELKARGYEVDANKLL